MDEWHNEDSTLQIIASLVLILLIAGLVFAIMFVVG